MKEKVNNPLLCDPETGVCEIPAERTETTSEDTAFKNEKPIRVLYYTDPICSGCWGIEPQLRRLKLEYGHVLDFEYRMGGLLPDWSYSGGGINKPQDVALHWDEVSIYYQMPIDGDIWLEDPLNSSYLPSIAFKAAQMQDAEKAIDFLRKMRELLFLQKKNITNWEYLEEAATLAGLNTGRLKNDYENGTAEKFFREDLNLARKKGVRGFPSIYLKNSDDDVAFVYGSRPYSYYEDAIRKLQPAVEKQRYEKSPKWLAEKFGSITAKELSVLCEITFAKAEEKLELLRNTGKLKRISGKNGSIYVNL